MFYKVSSGTLNLCSLTNGRCMYLHAKNEASMSRLSKIRANRQVHDAAQSNTGSLLRGW